MFQGTVLESMTVDDLENAALDAGMSPLTYLKVGMKNSVGAAAHDGVL